MGTEFDNLMLLVVAPLTVVYVFITGISSVNIQIVKRSTAETFDSIFV